MYDANHIKSFRIIQELYKLLCSRNHSGRIASYRSEQRRNYVRHRLSERAEHAWIRPPWHSVANKCNSATSCHWPGWCQFPIIIRSLLLISSSSWKHNAWWWIPILWFHIPCHWRETAKHQCVSCPWEEIIKGAQNIKRSSLTLFIVITCILSYSVSCLNVHV